MLGKTEGRRRRRRQQIKMSTRKIDEFVVGGVGQSFYLLFAFLAKNVHGFQGLFLRL